MIDIEKESEILEAGAAIIVPQDGLREKLTVAKTEDRPMVVKLGFDPTAPDLHLGHAVVMKKLKEFQDLGHKIEVIIGNFTAEIGDPTGKNKMRPPLSEEQVAINSKTYLDQLSKILDVNRIGINYNAEWFNVMSVREMIRLMAQHTLARIMEREDFSTRFKEGQPIAMHELVYPLLQGYDSLMINADVEIGGTDQLFNCMVGRYIQEVRGKVAQAVVCMPLLVGIDGKDKMSKSKGNYIGLAENPHDVYGKLMSIPDALIPDYIKLATDLNEQAKKGLLESMEKGENPMIVKKTLAHNVVRQFNGREAADEAELFFRKQVQERELDAKEFIEVSLSALGLHPDNLGLVDLCVAIEKDKSKSDIKRLILGGGISVEDLKISDIKYRFDAIKDGTRLKIGKRGYYLIKM